MNLIEKMKGLGLSDKEARVYISLVTLGSASAYGIANNSGLKRPTVYVILSQLMEKGLVQKVLRKRKHQYVPVDPVSLEQKAEQNLKYIKEVVPELESISPLSNDKKVRTLYFEGVSGIKNALWYRFDDYSGKEIVAFFGSAKDCDEEMIDLFHKWNKEIHKRNIQLQSLAPNARDLKTFRQNDKKHNFQSKILKKSLYSSEISIDVTPFFVRILFFKEKQAVIIESDKLVKSMRQIFSLVWNNIE